MASKGRHRHPRRHASPPPLPTACAEPFPCTDGDFYLDFIMELIKGTELSPHHHCLHFSACAGGGNLGGEGGGCHREGTGVSTLAVPGTL